MKRGLKRFLAVMVVLSMVLAAAGAWLLTKAMPIGTGYVAKYLCTSTFLSKRDPGVVFTEDIKPVNPLAKVVRWKIDRANQTVTASAFTAFRSKAIYREGCGCTLMAGTAEAALRRQQFYLPDADYAPPTASPDLPWPQGSGSSVSPATLGVDPSLLEKALDEAFTEPGEGMLRQTRAVAVVYDGQLIAERYAPGFGPDMPILGWSMSKSVTNALVGLLVASGCTTIQVKADRVGQMKKVALIGFEAKSMPRPGFVPADGPTPPQASPGAVMPARFNVSLAIVGGARAGEVIRLERSSCVIGRAGPDGSADLKVDDPTLSRAHATIECLGGIVVLRDMGSHNGTFVDEQRIETATLEDRAEFRLGRTRFMLILTSKE